MALELRVAGPGGRGAAAGAGGAGGVGPRVLRTGQTRPQRDARQQTLRVSRDVIETQPALTLFCLSAAVCDEQRQLPVPRPVRREQHNWRCIVRRNLRPNEQFESRSFSCDMSPHNTGHAVAIRNSQSSQAKFRGPIHQFVRV